MVTSHSPRLRLCATTGTFPAASSTACASALSTLRCSTALTSNWNPGRSGQTTSGLSGEPENCWPRRARKPLGNQFITPCTLTTFALLTRVHGFTTLPGRWLPPAQALRDPRIKVQNLSGKAKIGLRPLAAARRIQIPAKLDLVANFFWRS